MCCIEVGMCAELLGKESRRFRMGWVLVKKPKIIIIIYWDARIVDVI